MLLTYYGFLVASIVLLVAFNRSSVWSQTTRAHLSYLLVPPLILLVSILNLGFWATLVVSIIILLSDRLLGRYADVPVTRRTLYYSVGLLLVDGLVPLSISFTTQARADMQRVSMLIAAVLLLLAPILLLKLAPNVKDKL
jgi:hypothetical protein